jgi:hypothetical protein
MAFNSEGPGSKSRTAHHLLRQSKRLTDSGGSISIGHRRQCAGALLLGLDSRRFVGTMLRSDALVQITARASSR